VIRSLRSIPVAEINHDTCRWGDPAGASPKENVMCGKGLELGTWARIEEDCPIEFVALQDEVEMSLGGRRSGFDLVITEGGLENLILAAQGALRTFREREAADDADGADAIDLLQEGPRP
jgi:hypothetical protein